MLCLFHLKSIAEMTTYRSNKQPLLAPFMWISCKGKQAHPWPRHQQSVNHLPCRVKWSLQARRWQE